VRMCEWCEYYPAEEGSNICHKCAHPSQKLLELFKNSVDLK